MVKIAYQFLIKSKRKSLAVFASIVLSVALLVGIGSLIYSADISKSNYYKAIYGNYQYVYSIIGEKQLSLAENGKGTTVDIQNIGIKQDLYFSDEPIVLEVIGCNEEYLSMNGAKLISGTMPQNDEQIVVEEWCVGNLDLENGIGDTISVEGKEFKVVGIVSDTFEKYNKNLKTYTILNRTSVNDKYEVYVNFSTAHDIEKLSIEFMKYLGLNKDDRGANWEVIEPLGVKAPSDEQEWFVLAAIKSFAVSEDTVILLFGIFSAFIIYSILGISINQRLPQYGILDTLGASGFKLFQMIFLEIICLYLVGFPIGTIVGLAGSKLLYSHWEYIFLSTEITPSPFIISKTVIVNGFYFLALLLVFVTCSIIFKIKTQTSIEVLSDRSKSLQKKRKLLSANGGTLLNRLSHRYMTLKASVFVGVLISLSIGGIIMISSNYAINQSKIQNELTMKADDGLNSDYVVSMENSDFNIGVAEAEVSKIEQIAGIEQVCPVKHFIGATLINDEQYLNKHFFDSANQLENIDKYFGGICTEEDDGYLLKGNIYGYNESMIRALEDYVIDGSLDFKQLRKENSIIICLPQDGGTGQYNAVDIKPGDVLSIKVPRTTEVTDEMLKFTGDEDWYVTKEYTVAATVKRIMAHNDYFIGPYGLDIIMTNDMMTEEFGIDSFNLISITKQDDAERKIIADNIQEIVKSIDRCYIIDYTGLIAQENINLGQRQMFFAGVAVIVLLISMFHIINTINHIIITRRRDFGILRAMGLSDRDFMKMMLREGVLYGVYANVIMIVGVIIVTLIIFHNLKVMGLYIAPQYYINYPLLIACIIINIFLSIIAVIFPTKNIIKEEIIESIRKVE